MRCVHDLHEDPLHDLESIALIKSTSETRITKPCHAHSIRTSFMLLARGFGRIGPSRTRPMSAASRPGPAAGAVPPLKIWSAKEVKEFIQRQGRGMGEEWVFRKPLYSIE